MSAYHWSAEIFEKEADETLKRTVHAYIDGVNDFIENGNTPIEFRLLGIEKESFQLSDIYLIVGYMALGFAEGIKTDPLTEAMFLKTDSSRMADLSMQWPQNHRTIPVNKMERLLLSLSQTTSDILDNMPVAPWIGSNSWVISGKKTKNGRVLLSNDTHMGFSIPAVWYEAHLSYENTNLYGNYIAGLPFALVGHTEFCATGLTMFENDVLDFCKKQNIAVTGYSPIAQGRVFRNEIIKKIAQDHNKTPAQVSLRWLIQKDIIVIPKGSSKDHISENFNIFDFDLTDDEMNEIEGINTGKRMINPDFNEFDY